MVLQDNWFQDSSQIPKFMDALVPYIKWPKGPFWPSVSADVGIR